MVDSIEILPLTQEKFGEYIEVGKKSYAEHYLDLWQDRDPSPYIDESFTEEVLHRDLKNQNSNLFIIYSNNAPIGVLKIIVNRKIGHYTSDEALLLQKIYLLNECSGTGIGSYTLAFVLDFAKRRNKKVVWLDVMKKGRALQFYLKKGFRIHDEIQHKSPQVIERHRDMYIMVKELDTVNSRP
ncbi:MAG: GNAT family N-acetyltransferase [Aurantibacter sp.]